jgi:hypothetical protein
MNGTGFLRLPNPDSTIDLICLSCFVTVAQSRACAELSLAEEDHVCRTSDLTLLQSARALNRVQDKQSYQNGPSARVDW